MSILTAIGKQELKIKLEKEGYDVFKFDLQYQEAVLDILSKYKEIDTIFLNSLLPGEMTIYEFINKIKKINSKIKIIIILEKENEELLSFLNSKNIFDIYYNNKIKIEELIYLIKNNNKKEETKKINFIKIKNIINKFKKIKKNKFIKNNENKIINIIGPPGSRQNNFYYYFFVINKKQKNINYRFR